MRTEQEIRKRLDELTDFICIIGTQTETMAARNELIWVLGVNPGGSDETEMVKPNWGKI
jgi:hypothetical protein